MVTVTNAHLVIDDLERWAEVTGQELGQAVASAALQVFSATVTRTPVDTGRARGNWQITINRPAQGATQSTQNPIQGASSVVRNFSEGSIWITNNLSYIIPLEFGLYGDGDKTTGGFSKQAPKGMLRVSVAEFDSALRKAVRAANQSL